MSEGVAELCGYLRCDLLGPTFQLYNQARNSGPNSCQLGVSFAIPLIIARFLPTSSIPSKHLSQAFWIVFSMSSQANLMLGVAKWVITLSAM